MNSLTSTARIRVAEKPVKKETPQPKLVASASEKTVAIPSAAKEPAKQAQAPATPSVSFKFYGVRDGRAWLKNSETGEIVDVVAGDSVGNEKVKQIDSDKGEVRFASGKTIRAGN